MLMRQTVPGKSTNQSKVVYQGFSHKFNTNQDFLHEAYQTIYIYRNDNEQVKLV